MKVDTLKRRIICTLMVLMMISSIACSSNNTSDIVGAWLFTYDDGFIDYELLILTADGTGVWDGEPTKWEVENNILRLIIDEDDYFMEFEFNISNNEMTLRVIDSEYEPIVGRKLNQNELENLRKLADYNQARNSLLSELFQFSVQCQAWYRHPNTMKAEGTPMESLIDFIQSGATGTFIRTPVGNYTFSGLSATQVVITSVSSRNPDIVLQATVLLAGGPAPSYGITIIDAP